MLWIFPSLVLFVKEFEKLVTIAGSIFHYRFVEHGQAINFFQLGLFSYIMFHFIAGV